MLLLAREKAARLPVLVIFTALSLIGCTVQLTQPYSRDIDEQATSLQSDFLTFVADMQMQAGTPDAYYSKNQAAYGDFEARLAVITLRSESLPGGLPCGRAVDQGKKAERLLSGAMQAQVSARVSQPGFGNASCVTILATIAGEQMERLRSQHKIRCNPTANPLLCTTLFASPPIFAIVGTAQSEAPLVSAVSISLNELVGAERDIKPATSG